MMNKIVAEVDPFGSKDDLGLSDIGDLLQFLLVERNVGAASDTQSHWFSTHESTQEVSEYNIGQEYAEEWKIEMLVNLDTGERFEPRYGITFEPVKETP